MDPALYAMLHGEASASTSVKRSPSISTKIKGQNSSEISPFEAAYEESFQRHIDQLMAQQNPENCQFLSQKAQRAKIEKEARDTLNCSELEAFIAKAISIIEEEDPRYLSEESQIALMQEINQLRLHMKELDFEGLNHENLKTAFSISKEGCESLLQLGIKKFNEGLLADSLALFAFLSTMNPDDADYAYRLGIIAQKNERFDLAIYAYKAASILDSKMVGPYLFAAQCYVKANQIENASKELAEAIKILNAHESDSEWHPIIKDLESLLMAKKGG